MKVLIYDDELLFSEALGALLSRRGHDIVAHAASADELSRALDDISAEVSLFSVKEPGAVELLHELKRRVRTLPVVVITEPDTSLLRAVEDAGADGVCLKLDGIDEIESVFVRARSDTAGEWSRGALNLVRRRVESTAASLTPKEQAVLEQLVRGASTAAVASSLGIGEATVRTHLQHLFTKFGVHSRLALVACAVRTDAVMLGNDYSDSRKSA